MTWIAHKTVGQALLPAILQTEKGCKQIKHG
jgi:hypothetical protein